MLPWPDSAGCSFYNARNRDAQSRNVSLRFEARGVAVKRRRAVEVASPCGTEGRSQEGEGRGSHVFVQDLGS